METIDIYLEDGSKRILAGAMAYPGWARNAKSESEAIEALYSYRKRYENVLTLGVIPFSPPDSLSDMVVVERIDGGSGTDFGAMESVPSVDLQPVNEDELAKQLQFMHAGWLAFQNAVQAAHGKELKRGPRGGGRDLEKIVHHLVESQVSYLKRINIKAPAAPDGTLSEKIEWIERQVAEGLTCAVRDGVPETGPRGGKMWTPRHFVRHSAWHLLDHVWEIEDRIL